MSLDPRFIIRSLSHADQVRMANMVLAGWQIAFLQWHEGPRKWRGRRTRPDRQLYANSLRSLLDYIDD